MSPEKLGELELLVLLAVLRLDEGEAYAVSIVDEIERQTGRAVGRASVYVTVQRLERKGLVSTWLGEPRHERGGKARRCVGLQPAGLEAVRSAREALTSMWNGLEPALEGSR